MAATFATSSIAIGLGSSSLASPSRASTTKGTCLTSGFVKSFVGVRNPLRQAGASGGKFTWLWLVTWHLGPLICLTFGQIGFKGRTEEYF